MRRSFRRMLRHLVPDHLHDGAGGYREVWREAGILWADLRASSGRADVTDIGRDPALRVRITMHALPDDHPDRPAQGDRLRDGGRLFEVDAVAEADADRRYLVCWAHEVPTTVRA